MKLQKSRAKNIEKVKRRIGIILWILYLLSFIPFFGAMLFYSKTFISIWYVIGVGLIFGIFVGVFSYEKIKNYIDGKLKNHITFCVLTLGSLLAFVLLWTNYNFPRHEEKTYYSKIIDCAMSNRRSSSIATIEFAGIVKDIRLPIEDYDAIKSGNDVIIRVDKGFFGIYIILDKKMNVKK